MFLNKFYLLFVPTPYIYSSIDILMETDRFSRSDYSLTHSLLFIGKRMV